MRRRTARVGLGVVVGLCLAVLVSSAVGAGNSGVNQAIASVEQQPNLSMAERDPLAEPRPNTTVVASQQGHLFALAPNGTLTFFDDAYDAYWDVDPSPVGQSTVLYSATDRVDGTTSDCNPVGQSCIQQYIERVNLTTGEVTRLHSRIDGRYGSSQWHDVDRINESHFLVADMSYDRIFVVDAETGFTTWAWTAQSDFPFSSGGPYPQNWAHLNDVEVLPDGRIMVSLRNHDRVVFLDPETGLQRNWTLGREDDYEVLYEQHNPDYIPAARGGPAVLVADSENNRIVEYQRVDGEWHRSWQWADQRLQWPRDADRLPNGNTLVGDTHGQRVVEISPDGVVVWRAEIGPSYDVERLDTGDESAGGQSAHALGLENRTAAAPTTGVRTLGDVAEASIRAPLPNKWLNGAASVRPGWMGFWDQFVLLFAVLGGLVWLALEALWSPYRLQLPIVRQE